MNITAKRVRLTHATSTEFFIIEVEGKHWGIAERHYKANDTRIKVEWPTPMMPAGHFCTCTFTNSLHSEFRAMYELWTAVLDEACSTHIPQQEKQQ
jgi:hypothetical protein